MGPYDQLMELILDGCSVPSAHVDAMKQGLAAMQVQDVKVIATSNFVSTIAALTGDPSYAAARGGGVVAAKTIPEGEDSTIVLNFDVLSEGSLSAIEHTLAHEAGHVIINRRGNEETSGFRNQTEAEWQWWLKVLGAQAIVENRIERSLIELGYPASESTLPVHVDESLQIVNDEIVAAVIDPASADPAHLRDMIFTTLNHVTKLLAYVAAPLIVGQPGLSPSQLSAEGQTIWNDYIAPSWQRRIESWSEIPPALTPIGLDSWRNILTEARDLERAFLLDFGFKFEDLSNGQYAFHRVGSDELFTERLSRARIELP